MEKSEQIDQLAAALANAQGKIRGASKDSSNPFYRSKYADLESCWDAIRDAFTENGLAVAQPVSLTDGAVTVTTILLHTSGQWMSERMTMTPMRQGKGGEWVFGTVPVFDTVKEAVDATGAGDVFNGALAVALSEGKGLEESVRFANAAAALSVTKLGAQPSIPMRGEIEGLGSNPRS